MSNYIVKKYDAILSQRYGKQRYPFNQMVAEGDGFMVPKNDHGAVLHNNGRPRVSGAAYTYARKHNFKVSVRQASNGDWLVRRES